MNNQRINALGRITLLIIFNLSLVACSGGGETPADETPVNTAPVASDASVSLLPSGSVKGTLAVNDVDGDNVTISIVTDASNGTLTLDDAATGAYKYIHDGAANGDSFTFWANDGLLDSNIATVTVTTVIPDAPASGILTTPGDQRVTLNWDAVPGADSYNVYWAGTSGTGTGGTKITDVTSPFYHDGIDNVGDYYYVVTAVNAVGESAASDEVSATPVDIPLSSLTFADDNLRACVEAHTMTTKAVYVHDISFSLYCNSKGITQLSGIEALTSLTSLSLGINSISDVSPLAGLTGLTILELFANSISEVSPLAGLTNLTYFRLDINNITDLSSLTGLTGLTNLRLGDNSISDVSPLAGLTGLTLTLHRNSISDVRPLAGLIKLDHLILWDNSSISDVSPLADLTGLTSLDLRFNSGFSKVDSLVTLTSATTIALDRNIGMSCSELTILINTLGSPPVDIGAATDGVNCTNP